ncbi:hypothetical protein PROFUN_09723 [Planoprotostelium fungivorum]|uniref:Uncharacterized protein n=1 Tax=Planoprotostelium fungivorum TaxID=1890364 RepID=A0A2P6NEU6_9EUKA|nr:hypothetical protein PROFUN_09723 [Planoprotostelium fungivorum]
MAEARKREFIDLSEEMFIFNQTHKHLKLGMSEKVGGHSLPNGTPTTDNKYVADNSRWKATGPGYSVSYNYLWEKPNRSTLLFVSLCLLYDLSECIDFHPDCLKQVQSTQMLTNVLQRITKQNTGVSENSATKKHIQCMFIEKEHLGFLWFIIILYKQRLIELFGSYVKDQSNQGFFLLHLKLFILLKSNDYNNHVVITVIEVLQLMMEVTTVVNDFSTRSFLKYCNGPDASNGMNKGSHKDQINQFHWEHLCAEVFLFERALLIVFWQIQKSLQTETENKLLAFTASNYSASSIGKKSYTDNKISGGRVPSNILSWLDVCQNFNQLCVYGSGPFFVGSGTNPLIPMKSWTETDFALNIPNNEIFYPRTSKLFQYPSFLPRKLVQIHSNNVLHSSHHMIIFLRGDQIFLDSCIFQDASIKGTIYSEGSPLICHSSCYVIAIHVQEVSLSFKRVINLLWFLSHSESQSLFSIFFVAVSPGPLQGSK